MHLLPLDLGAMRYGRHVLNAGHVAAFALLAFATARALRGAVTTNARFSLRYDLAAAAPALAVAAAFEAAQIPTSRDASFADLSRDGMGIAAGLLLAAGLRRRPHTRWLLATAATVLIGVAGPAYGLLTVLRADFRFPVLLDFESRMDLSAIETDATTVAIVPAPARWTSTGRVLRVSPSGGARYHGISVADIAPNWTAYESLRFEVAADSDTGVALFVRINDSRHDGNYDDRYNVRIGLSDERVEVSLPLADIRQAPRSRQLDLTRIAQLTIFLDGSVASAFYIDNLRLE